MKGFDLRSNIIYTTAIILTILFARYYQSVNKNKTRTHVVGVASLVSLPMVLILGLRSINVGYDTYMYVHYMYERRKALPKAEVLFTWSLNALRYLFGSDKYYVMLLFFSEIAIVIAFAALLSVHEEIDFVWFVIAYLLIFALCLTDQFRQLIGVSMFLASVCFLYNKKYLSALLVLLAGTGIHNTVAIAGLLFCICYLIALDRIHETRILYGSDKYVSIKFSLFLFLCIILAAVGLFLLFKNKAFVDYVKTILPPKYVKYFTTYLRREKIGLGVVLDMMPILPVLLLKDKIQNRIEWTMYIFCYMAPLFRLCGYLSYFLYRMMYYPEIVAFALMAILSCRMKEKTFWNITAIGFCIVFYVLNYVYLNNHGAFPYYFFFE